MRLVLACLLGLWSFAATPAWAADYPPAPTKPVFDQANLLPADREAALDARLTEYNRRTGRALVVATVSSLEGEPIEMYAVKLFETWGIGGAKSDQGLLLLVAPTERKVRIETGYGLHQYVTDALSGRIIRNDITPRFKQGDYPSGIEAGVNALVTQLDRTPEDAKAQAEAAAAAQARATNEQGGGGFGSVIFWIVLIVFLSSMFSRRGRGGRRRGMGGGALAPIILWDAMSRGGGGGFGGGFGGGGGGFGGGFGGFGGGGSGGGGASGSW